MYYILIDEFGNPTITKILTQQIKELYLKDELITILKISNKNNIFEAHEIIISDKTNKQIKTAISNFNINFFKNESD